MRRISSLLALSALALTACGGSDETADTTPAPAETEAAPPETEAPAETTAATPAETAAATTEAPAETTVSETAASETAASETAASETAAPSGAVAVSLVEWEVETSAEVAAGTVTFDVSNDGSFPHHFAVARGNSYEELPKSGGSGAIDEVALGDDYIGRTANVQSGGTETIEFDLDAGNYVFFCNIAGTRSHAAQGQVLSVTVS